VGLEVFFLGYWFTSVKLSKDQEKDKESLPWSYWEGKNIFLAVSKHKNKARRKKQAGRKKRQHTAVMDRDVRLRFIK
jgi:hypothetical protein